MSCICCDNSSSMTCSRCKSVRYCSRECQLNDWPKHKSACSRTVDVTKLCERVNELSEKYIGCTNCVLSSVLVASVLKIQGIDCDVFAGYLLITDGPILRHAWLQIDMGQEYPTLVETNPMAAEDVRKGVAKYEYQLDNVHSIEEDDKQCLILDIMLLAGIDKTDSRKVTNYDSVIAVAMRNIPGAKEVVSRFRID